MQMMNPLAVAKVDEEGGATYGEIVPSRGRPLGPERACGLPADVRSDAGDEPLGVGEAEIELRRSRERCWHHGGIEVQRDQFARG